MSIFSQSKKDVLLIDYVFETNFNETRKFASSLYISDSQSLFFWGNNNRILEEENDKGFEFKINVYESDSIGSYNYTDLTNRTISSRTVWLNKQKLRIKEGIPSLNWKISDEQKKIGNFNCQKATTNFRGRRYIAWFTSEIPTNIGPWKLHGLPGLILNVVDSEGDISLYAKQITKVPNNSFPKLPSEELQEISIEKYAELQNSLARDLKKKLMGKLPRGAEIEISSFDTLERFSDNDK